MATKPRSQSALRQHSFERGNKFAKSNPSISPSPSNANRRVAKLNQYLSKSAKSSMDQLHHAFSTASALPGSSHFTSIKRWDGNRRMTVKWDSVRRDPELWLPAGDCLLHFYERGQSRRGPSLRVSLAEIESSNCGPLLDRYYSNFPPESPPSSSDPERYPDAHENFNDTPAEHELYIPAPGWLTREEAFKYHLTTRNFFAWMYEKPLVGERLGDALVDLFARMKEFRPNVKENEDDMLAYIDNQGYSDFGDCPDHALAVLRFAENLQDRELWTDAFVHCAGMWEHLDTSGEFERVSRTSKALISRAHLEMDLRLERAGSALGNFLETDISGSYLGLGKDALSHLERFRSFLHQFYVGQHGYWPPTPLDRNGTGFPRAIYRSMYFDFQGLYEYLVDSSSGTSIQDNKPVDGGICVYQNISAFDKRHKYPSLPHSLPLIPKVPAQLNKEKPLSRLFGNKQAEQRRRLASSAALSIATNPTKKNVMNCPLVHQYYQFEHQWTVMEGSTVSCANARKVRWILVYAILQILISVTRAPKEVRDTESVSYPLCCQIAGTPPWQTDEKGEKLRPALQATRPLSFQETLLELGPDMDILSAKPSPLIIKKSPSPPHKVSIIHELSVKSPKPIRTASFEFLNEKSSDVSLIDYDSASPPQPGDVRPTERKPSPHCHNSDPTTPSTSEADSGHGGWSASSSDDGMDHHSVNGSDSNYGDGKDEEMPRNSARPSPAKRSSIGSFRPCSCNPEVDQYVRS